MLEDQQRRSRRPSTVAAEARFEDLVSMHLAGNAAGVGAAGGSSAGPAADGASGKLASFLSKRRPLSGRQSRQLDITCPFSHEPLDADSKDPVCAVDLRCCHRFALAHLGEAQRGSNLCSKAGFAQQDSLVCPLCGEQDSAKKPGSNNFVTAYSTNKDAYLGS